MGLHGRFYSSRDMNLLNSVNAELMRDIVDTRVVLFKIAAGETTVNIYGESSPETGKSFYMGIELTALIDRGDITSTDEGFGPDRDQTVVFKLRYRSCEDAGYFPEVGDLILFNSRYHEINNVVNEQLLGGQADNSHSIICNTQYSRLSSLNLVER